MARLLEINCCRRTLLLGATSAIVLNWRPAKAAQSVSPIMKSLSGYMAEAAQNPLPEAVLEQTKLHILDTLAAMVSGSTLLPGKAAMAFAKSCGGGEKVATVVASNMAIGPIDAALVNGELAHSDETDDSHAPSHTHPGAPTVAATLAAGEQFGIDGTRFVRAVALGYDVGTRVAMTLGLDFWTKGHKSTHSVGGNFGASAASGCCAGFDAQRMRWLLDYASQQSSGIAAWQRDTQHIEKGFAFAGMPARNGVTAALLVADGWTGIDDILSGPDNFFEAYAPGVDTTKLVDSLGSRFEVMRTSIKKWTVGSPIQAPLDALWALMQKHRFKADDVRTIIVRVASSQAAIVNNREMPDICLQHMIAVMLMDGTVSFASAHDFARMQDQRVLRERAKVTLVPDAELEKLMPLREATVDVMLNDGQQFSLHVNAVRGTPDNPMTRDEVVNKCRDLIAPVLGGQQCNVLTQAVLTLEKQDSVRRIGPLLETRAI